MTYEREIDLVRSGIVVTVKDFEEAIGCIRNKQTSNLSLPQVRNKILGGLLVYITLFYGWLILYSLNIHVSYLSFSLTLSVSRSLAFQLSSHFISYLPTLVHVQIPNVGWQDIGGLSNVKREILDSFELPLKRPELFANGLSKYQCTSEFEI